jgi:non-homologous end joining protein Ku
VLVEALRQTHRIADGTFTWRGNTTPIAIRLHQYGLLLQRLYFADEVQNDFFLGCRTATGIWS